MTRLLRARVGLLLAAAFLVLAGNVQAQGVAGAGRANATRQELEQRAATADPASAAAIRLRLTEGDFRAGDRIVIDIHGDSMLNDTVVVLAGPTIKLLSLPDDTLRGVLRSELQPHLELWVNRFYKNATVRATPLIRFGVLGEVNRPGYYRMPVDVSFTDAIMNAGGPTQRADMPKTIVRRRSQELLPKSAVRDAMVAGTTLDQLGLDAGDELVVGAKTERNWMNLVQVATLVSSIGIALFASRKF